MALILAPTSLAQYWLRGCRGAARNILCKYGLEPSTDGSDSDGDGAPPRCIEQKLGCTSACVSVRLKCANGTQFNSPPPHDAETEPKHSSESTAEAEVASWLNKDALAGHLPPLCLAPPPEKLYSKVLVDAECTHDGSIKHVAKFAAQSTAGGNSNSFGGWGWESFERRVLDPERIAAVTGLQQALLWNGFRLLAPVAVAGDARSVEFPPHGSAALVYSTCSFSRNQNEDVVAWLLKHCPSARVVRIGGWSPCKETSAAQAVVTTDESDAAVVDSNGGEGSGGADHLLQPWPCRESPFLANTLRFDPVTSGTSGLFVAKIIKLETL